MDKEFVPYELALRMKQLGFDDPCFGFYGWNNNKPIGGNYPCDGDNSAPLFQQAFRWFREKHEIEATTSCYYSKRLGVSYEEREYHCHIVRDGVTSKGPKYKTYEEAELACLQKLIEIVEQSKSEL